MAAPRFSTHFLVFGYSDETLFLVFDINFYLMMIIKIYYHNYMYYYFMPFVIFK